MRQRAFDREFDIEQSFADVGYTLPTALPLHPGRDLVGRGGIVGIDIAQQNPHLFRLSPRRRPPLFGLSVPLGALLLDFGRGAFADVPFIIVALGLENLLLSFGHFRELAQRQHLDLAFIGEGETVIIQQVQFTDEPPRRQKAAGQQQRCAQHDQETFHRIPPGLVSPQRVATA